MNERFFNLKQDKQDRMINAALKVFAENGYKRACTDEIVKEAQISKGLLFHYFVSKAGLYEFLFDYSTRYMKLELSGIVNYEKGSFWERCREIEAVKTQMMKKYPYIQLFLDTAGQESEETVGSEMKARQLEYREFVEQLYRKTDADALQAARENEFLMRIAGYLERGAMRHALCSEQEPQSAYLAEITEIFKKMEKVE